MMGTNLLNLIFSPQNPQISAPVAQILMERGIRYVVLEYDGCGDSGQFERVSAYREKNVAADAEGMEKENEGEDENDWCSLNVWDVQEKFDEVSFDFYVPWTVRETVFRNEKWERIDVEKQVKASDAVEDMGYELLEYKYPGWEINEGSTGHIILDLKGRNAVFEHGNRSIEYDSDTLYF